MGPKVAIVGAGFGGIGTAISLRRAGFSSVTVFERGPNVGGVWRENTYPGAACDVPSHLYSYSFEPNHRWSRRFSPQPEILAYLECCVERYGLAGSIRLETPIRSARFDPAKRRLAPGDRGGRGSRGGRAGLRVRAAHAAVVSLDPGS
jgi:cation diffusion facilitator CzcD-associated flavoprotein CzcO